MPWPNYGQGALAAKDYGLLQTHGEQKAAPMASVTKVVTALAILKQKPLELGQQGPIITLNSDDVAIYNSYFSGGGSVVKVENGQQISEYQALQALLIPSANNFADTLARWAFGSMENYVSFANKMLADMGLKNTKVADASGFSPQSVSTAQDLARLGLAVMDKPIIAEVVKQEKVTLPVAGEVNNINWLLGEDGVIGIKTGNTDEAGGCFLFAAARTVAGQNVTFLGAIMQAPDRNTAIRDSHTIIQASDDGFENIKVAAKGQAAASYQAPWGATADAVIKEDTYVLVWRGSQVQVSSKLNEITASAKAGSSAGYLSITAGQKSTSVPLVLKNDLSAPPWHWRLFR